VKMRTESVLLF